MEIVLGRGYMAHTLPYVMGGRERVESEAVRSWLKFPPSYRRKKPILAREPGSTKLPGLARCWDEGPVCERRL